MIGENVRRLRVARGWSQEKLAEQVGVTQGAISQIERGTTAPLVKTLERLATALDTTAAGLLVPHQELHFAPPIRIRDSYNDAFMKLKQIPDKSNNIP